VRPARRLTFLPLSVSRLFKQCEILDIRQSCRPPQPVTGMALLFTLLLLLLLLLMLFIYGHVSSCYFRFRSTGSTSLFIHHRHFLILTFCCRICILIFDNYGPSCRYFLSLSNVFISSYFIIHTYFTLQSDVEQALCKQEIHLYLVAPLVQFFNISDVIRFSKKIITKMPGHYALIVWHVEPFARQRPRNKLLCNNWC
jgi:hypothetical protein